MVDKICGVYKKYKQVILYLFFGGLSFLLSMITYYIFTLCCNVLVANILSWVIVVAFSYITNEKFVFTGDKDSRKITFRKISQFYMGRLFTLGIEEIILYLFILVLGLNDILIKIIAQMVVIILNYIISKFVIFKKKEVRKLDNDKKA